MAWNEPGGGKRNPWERRPGQSGSELDEIVRNWQRRLAAIFGSRTGRPAGGPARVNWGAIALLIAAFWGATGFYMSSTLPITPVLTAPQGGAISRIAPDATAFPYREARHNLLVAAAWNDASGDEAHMTWARGAWKNLEPFTRGFYVNDNNADISERRVLENYGPNYSRLAALKAKYDPTNLFRLNANVKPRA